MQKVKIDLNKQASGNWAGSGWGSNKATIWIDNTIGLVCLRAPKHVEFSKWIITSIPKQDRGFDDKKKIWKFAPSHIDAIVSEAEKYFEVTMLPSIQATSNNHYEILLSALSLEGLRSVWRTVAMELHPDKGGDTETFVKAKNAYDAIIRGKQ